LNWWFLDYLNFPCLKNCFIISVIKQKILKIYITSILYLDFFIAEQKVVFRIWYQRPRLTFYQIIAELMLSTQFLRSRVPLLPIIHSFGLAASFKASVCRKTFPRRTIFKNICVKTCLTSVTQRISDDSRELQVGGENMYLVLSWERCPFRATGRPVGRDGRDALGAHSLIRTRSEMHIFLEFKCFIW